MNLKAITTLVFGAIVASSISTPTGFGSGNVADAADAVAPAPQATVRLPEFVPVVNYSAFVRAAEKFGAENPSAARQAAEALSARFAGGEEKPRPVTIVNVVRQEPPMGIPASAGEPTVMAPDPVEKPVNFVSDPLKIAKASATDSEPSTAGQKVGKQASSTKKFRPAMGLGMAPEADDSASFWPPFFSSAKPKQESAPKKAARVSVVEPTEKTAPGAKTAAKDGVINERLQIGVPGQSLEPLVSRCAKVERDCEGKFFCGC